MNTLRTFNLKKILLWTAATSLFTLIIGVTSAPPGEKPTHRHRDASSKSVDASDKTTISTSATPLHWDTSCGTSVSYLFKAIPTVLVVQLFFEMIQTEETPKEQTMEIKVNFSDPDLSNAIKIKKLIDSLASQYTLKKTSINIEGYMEDHQARKLSDRLSKIIQPSS